MVKRTEFYRGNEIPPEYDSMSDAERDAWFDQFSVILDTLNSRIWYYQQEGAHVIVDEKEYTLSDTDDIVILPVGCRSVLKAFVNDEACPLVGSGYKNPQNYQWPPALMDWGNNRLKLLGSWNAGDTLKLQYERLARPLRVGSDIPEYPNEEWHNLICLAAASMLSIHDQERNAKLSEELDREERAYRRGSRQMKADVRVELPIPGESYE
jgi:hypothetical protein